MATFAKPPCDEASILAQPCAEPSAANGGRVLATTILGSSMAFIDGTVVNVPQRRMKHIAPFGIFCKKSGVFC